MSGTPQKEQVPRGALGSTVERENEWHACSSMVELIIETLTLGLVDHDNGHREPTRALMQGGIERRQTLPCSHGTGWPGEDKQSTTSKTRVPEVKPIALWRMYLVVSKENTGLIGASVHFWLELCQHNVVLGLGQVALLNHNLHLSTS